MNKGGWEDPLIWGKDGEQALPLLLQSWTVCMIRNLLVTDPGISYNCVWFLSRLSTLLLHLSQPPYPLPFFSLPGSQVPSVS